MASATRSGWPLRVSVVSTVRARQILARDLMGAASLPRLIHPAVMVLHAGMNAARPQNLFLQRRVELMNHIYRLCWNRSLSQWVPASELAHSTRASGGSRKRGVAGQRVMALSLLAMSLSMPGLARAGTAPTGGQIVSGAAQIQQVGNVTTIRQDSSTLMLNWQSFNIGSDQTVNFLQPGSNAIAVNRIFSSTPSEIYGHLNANGQVWLINPNGVLFGQSAQVNVGGLVASTLDVDDSTLDSSNRSFSGSGKGSVINRGTITAANGGYVALLGNQVSNQGTITAQLGTVALAGGSAVTLTFTSSQLVHLQVDQSTLN